MEKATEYSQFALNEGVDPLKTLRALAGNMKEVDRKYNNGEIELNDVMWAAINMKEALPNIKKAIRQEGSERKSGKLSGGSHLMMGTWRKSPGVWMGVF